MVVTRANAVSERKKSFRKFDFFSFAVWTNVKRKKSVRRRNKKNIAGQVLTYNSKNFHWQNRKLDQERTMNGFWKPFRKEIQKIQKIEKTVKIKVKLPHVNKKPLARKRIFVQTPFSRSTLNLERKNFNHYSNLTSKIMKICEQIFKKNSAPIQCKFFEL